MHYLSGTRPPGPRAKRGPARFGRLSPQESSTADLLQGCPVVTAAGDLIGTVDHLMVDLLTHHLRYVMLERRKNSALIVIPWQALYFDAAQSRLVFYTLA